MFDTASVRISYSRDAKNRLQDIQAKLGKTVFRTQDAAGLTIRYEDRDFILKYADIEILFPPEKGDIIEFDSLLYQVAAPDGEPCWKWHSRQTHKFIRIHTKFAGRANE